MTTMVTFYRLVQKTGSKFGRKVYILLTCAGYQFELETPEPLEPDDVLSFWRSHLAPKTLWDEFAVYNYEDTWGFLNSAGFRRVPGAERQATGAIRDGLHRTYRWPSIFDVDIPHNFHWLETMPAELVEKYGHGTPPAKSGWPGF